MNANASIPIGIDFGTCNTSISIAVPDSGGNIKPQPVLFNNKYFSIPTAISFSKDGYPIFGQEAVRYGYSNPNNTYLGFKKYLNSYNVFNPRPDSKIKSADQLIRIFFEYILDNIKKNGGSVNDIVVCKPVEWGNQLDSILRSIDISPYLLDEPAAILYYAHVTQHLFSEIRNNVLIIDFGGSTCNFLLFKVRASLQQMIVKPQPEIIDHTNIEFGGNNIDKIIIIDIIEKWKKRFPGKTNCIGKFGSPNIKWLLENKAKYLKETLSYNFSIGARDPISIELYGLPEKTSLVYTLDYRTMQNLISPRILREFAKVFIGNDHIEPLLDLRGLTLNDIDVILLAGGSNKLPCIESYVLPEIFPRLPKKPKIILLENPEFAVSYGAALFAYDFFALKKPRMPRYLLKDLRIDLDDGTTYLLAKKGTRLPLKEGPGKNYFVFKYPSRDNKLLIRLVAGNEKTAGKNSPLSSIQKEIEFKEEVFLDELMEMNVYIDYKGEILLNISKASPLLRKKKIYTLLFQPIELTSRSP